MRRYRDAAAVMPGGAGVPNRVFNPERRDLAAAKMLVSLAGARSTAARRWRLPSPPDAGPFTSWGPKRYALGARRCCFARSGDEGIGVVGGGAAVVEPPASWDRHRYGVQLAQVVAVWVALAAQVVEPHLRAVVLVRQRRCRRLRAIRPAALPTIGVVRACETEHRRKIGETSRRSRAWSARPGNDLKRS